MTKHNNNAIKTGKRSNSATILIIHAPVAAGKIADETDKQKYIFFFGQYGAEKRLLCLWMYHKNQCTVYHNGKVKDVNFKFVSKQNTHANICVCSICFFSVY